MVLYSSPDESEEGCTSFRVDVDSASLNGILVHVDKLHEDNTWMPIPAGSSVTFRYRDCGIRRVIAQGEYGPATNVTYGVVSKT